jgi:hypothetical protein
MAARPAEEGSAASRPFSLSLLRRHAAFLALLAIAAPAIVAFAWQRDIATIGDDSVSYLLLAQHIAAGTPAIVERWVFLRSNFPPLFPLALALTGGAYDFLAAHLVVAAFAILALVAIYRFALLRFGSPLGALAVCAVFLVTPDAWVSAKGILSEPMFLFVSLCTLAWHARRLEGRDGTPREWLVFGVLLGLTVLTRAAGVALVAAYAVQAVLRAARERRRSAWRLALPALPLAILVGLWLAWRPGGAPDAYRVTSQQMLAAWLTHPVSTAHAAAAQMFTGWIASFLAQSTVGAIAKGAFALLGIVAIAGSIHAAIRNRLEGWYALASLAMTFAWVFGEDNTRRLLYPLLPVLMVNAAMLAKEALPASVTPRMRRAVLGSLAALPILLCLPAAVVLAGKALDREPLAPGGRVAYADGTSYYTTISVQSARLYTAHDMAVVEGLGDIATATPPGSRVMWSRPEYVALLGHREGVPFYYSWSERRFAQAILDQRVDYVVVAAVYKTDLTDRAGDPYKVHEHLDEYAQRVLRIANPVNGAAVFGLFRVDPGRVKAFLARGAGG